MDGTGLYPRRNKVYSLETYFFFWGPTHQRLYNCSKQHLQLEAKCSSTVIFGNDSYSSHNQRLSKWWRFELTVHVCSKMRVSSALEYISHSFCLMLMLQWLIRNFLQTSESKPWSVIWKGSDSRNHLLVVPGGNGRKWWDVCGSKEESAT